MWLLYTYYVIKVNCSTVVVICIPREDVLLSLMTMKFIARRESDSNNHPKEKEHVLFSNISIKIYNMVAINEKVKHSTYPYCLAKLT